MNIEDFNMYMVKVHLMPYADRYKFSFKVEVDPKVFLQEYDKTSYTPWRMVKDHFGGIVFMNECINIYEYQQPVIIRKDFVGKFIVDNRANYPMWIGFFKNIFSINKEYKNFRQSLIQFLDKNRVEDEDLKFQIKNFQFRK